MVDDWESKIKQAEQGPWQTLAIRDKIGSTKSVWD